MIVRLSCVRNLGIQCGGLRWADLSFIHPSVYSFIHAFIQLLSNTPRLIRMRIRGMQVSMKELSSHSRDMETMISRSVCTAYI